MGHGHLLTRLAVAALLIATTATGCSARSDASSPSPTAASSVAGSSPAASAAPGSDADLPLGPAAPAAPVPDVPATRVVALRAQLAQVWGVRIATATGTLRGTGTDAPSGVRFAVTGRTEGAGVRGYTCTATPAKGRFAVATGDAEPAPEVLAAMETALGFLQTCADSAAADPDRATVWVRAVTQQVLHGTPAERRIGGVRFRLDRSGDGLRLAIGAG